MPTIIAGAVLFYRRYEERYDAVGPLATDTMLNRLVNNIGNPLIEPLEAYNEMKSKAEQVPDLFQEQSDSIAARESVEIAVGRYVNMIE